MAVPFRLDTVLQGRESEKLRCQTAYAAACERLAGLERQRDDLTEQRSRVLDEIHAWQEHGDCTADQCQAWQDAADRLATLLSSAQTAVLDARADCARRQAELREAEVSVSALEKLAGRPRPEDHRGAA